MRKIITTTVFGFILALTACDKGEPAKADKQAKTDKQAKAADGGGEAADGGGEAEGGDAEAPSLHPDVERAVEIANKISANPGDADSILEAANLSRDDYEALLYEIARNPQWSQQYTVARNV
mgnify:FL=1